MPVKNCERQTLQFKAALEKCLETSIPSEECDNDNHSQKNSPRQSHHLRKFKSLLTNAQPIKPWSADLDEADTIEDIWNDSPAVAAPWQDKSNFESQQKNSSSLEEQIDSVIQMFFNSQTETNSETQPEVDGEVGEAVSTWDAKFGQRKSIASPLESAIYQDTITVNAETSSEEEATLQPNPIASDDYWQEISQLTQIEILPEEGQYLEHDDTGSPSPIVYPNRPTKKRDSLAAVELPKFKSQTKPQK
jgi:hypothetical protein